MGYDDDGSCGEDDLLNDAHDYDGNVDVDTNAAQELNEFDTEDEDDEDDENGAKKASCDAEDFKKAKHVTKAELAKQKKKSKALLKKKQSKLMKLKKKRNVFKGFKCSSHDTHCEDCLLLVINPCTCTACQADKLRHIPPPRPMEWQHVEFKRYLKSSQAKYKCNSMNIPATSTTFTTATIY